MSASVDFWSFVRFIALAALVAAPALFLVKGAPRRRASDPDFGASDGGTTGVAGTHLGADSLRCDGGPGVGGHVCDGGD